MSRFDRDIFRRWWYVDTVVLLFVAFVFGSSATDAFLAAPVAAWNVPGIAGHLLISGAAVLAAVLVARPMQKASGRRPSAESSRR